MQTERPTWPGLQEQRSAADKGGAAHAGALVLVVAAERQRICGQLRGQDIRTMSQHRTAASSLSDQEVVGQAGWG